MTKTTYKVTGTTPFMDVQPGETFEADLDEELEQRAVERGSIRILKKGQTKKEDSNDG